MNAQYVFINEKTEKVLAFSNATLAHQVYEQMESLQKRVPKAYRTFVAQIEQNGCILIGAHIRIIKINPYNRKEAEKFGIALLAKIIL